MTPRQADLIFRRCLQSVAFILLLGVFLRLFIFSSFVMSGVSMLPSVWPGDFLLANKLGLAQLRRGDIVALRCPSSVNQTCLKRIVGLPGDRVEFRLGLLTVNEQSAVLHPISDDADGKVVSEEIDGESWWISPAQNAEAATSDTPPVVVPPGEVYLLNDKRELSEDSRQWGPVKMDLIEGKVRRIWLSLDWFDGENVRTWPRLRTERLFRGVN